MKKYLKEEIKNILPVKFKKILKTIIKRVQQINSVKLPIIMSHAAGEIILKIKDETMETVVYPKIYGRSMGGEIRLKSSKINLMKYQEAIVFPLSDFIITDVGVVWHKFHNSQFFRMIPRDPDLLNVNGNSIFIKKKKYSKKVNIGYSLCGMSSTIWPHFLVEHLPKIYFIRDLQKSLGEILTVIVPTHTDPHVREITYNYLSEIQGIDILELKDNEVACCTSLYHIENTAFFMDDMLYASFIEDMIIPEFVAKFIQDNLLVDLLLKINLNQYEHKNEKEIKLYVGRNGNTRNLRNRVEVEQYFKNKGFIVIYPHTLTLNEKISLFKRAVVVAGPGSSGFMNLIFSNRGTKVLCFINNFRSFEPYIGFLTKYFELNSIMITGVDDLTSGSVGEERNNSYTIPIAKITEVCEEMGI
jgi:hypothetical protein